MKISLGLSGLGGNEEPSSTLVSHHPMYCTPDNPTPSHPCKKQNSSRSD